MLRVAKKMIPFCVSGSDVRSSYFLDMLGLPDVFSESELETAILNQIQLFMKEFGNDIIDLNLQ